MINYNGILLSPRAAAAGVALLTALLLLASCQDGAPAPLGKSKIAFSGDSSLLAKTEVVPTFEAAMPGGSNTIWCNTFQIAWTSLKDEVFGEPILVSEEEELSGLLNESKAGAGDIAPRSYYVKAGISTPEFLDQLYIEMAEKFPEVQVPHFEPDEKVLAYAYLYLAMQFPIPYEIFEDGVDFTASTGETTMVKAFGIDPESTGTYQIMSQIEVLFYEELEGYQYEYAIDLWRDSQTYQLVLAKIAPGESLAATFDRVAELESQHSDSPDYRGLNPTDELLVPEIWWRIEHRYSQLEKKPFLNEGFGDQMIAAAYQMIDFKLDNKGVVLESAAHIDGAETAPAPGRRFVFDEPFLLHIKKRGADTPLFAIWIDNAELLVKPE